MPLGSFGAPVSRNATTEELAELVSKLIKEVTYLLNGGLDTLNVNELNADVVNAGTLNANLVSVAAANGGKSFTIDTNGIKANNGSVDTLKFDLATGLLTIVSALIQSANGNVKVVLDPTNNNFRIEQNATTNITFNPNYLGTTPVINFHQGTFDGYVGYFNAQKKFVLTTDSDAGVEVEISNGGLSGDVSLRPVDNVNVPSWSRLINELTGHSLQADLNSKANTFSGYSGSFSTGTQTVFVSNGIITGVV